MGNPLFLGKQIPESALNTPGMNLTALTLAEIERINGTMDFLAIDPYTAQFATVPPGGIDACLSDVSDPNFPFCVQTTNTHKNGWLIGNPGNDTFYIAPQYVRQQLKYLWDTFHPAGGILITEFGFPVLFESFMAPIQQRFDVERTLYFNGFLRETIAVIHEDGVPVIGALAWTNVDNNEWGDFDVQLGLQQLNRTDFTRTYKRSFFDFVDFFHDNIESENST